MKKHNVIKLLSILCLVGVGGLVVALTVARPLTAEVYHSLRNTYAEFTTRSEVEKLYQYTPESSEPVILSDLRLPEAPPL